MLTTTIETKVKPKLVLAFDQSSSMLLNGELENLESVFTAINNSELSNIYKIKNIGFGEGVSEIDTLSFNDARTNFEKLEESLNLLLTKNDGAILVSDGNVNKGSLSVFNKNNSYSLDVIGVGDTISKPIISISKINYNKKVVVGNSFPLEVFIESSDLSGELKLDVLENEKKILYENISILPNIDSKQRLRHSLLLKSKSEGVHYFKLKLYSKVDKNLYSEKVISVDFVKNRGSVLIKYSHLNPDVSLFKRKLTERNYKVTVTRNAISKKKIQKFDFIIDFDNSLERNIGKPIVSVNSSYELSMNNQNRLEFGLDKKFLESYSINSKSKIIYLEAFNLWQLNLNEAKNGKNKLEQFFDSLIKEIELLKYSDKFNVVFKDVYSSSEDVVIELINESSQMNSVRAMMETQIEGKKYNVDFIEEDGRYTLNLGKQIPSSFTGKITVNGKKLKTIRFLVKDIDLELLGKSQNIELLRNVASNQGKRVYNLSNYTKLLDKLTSETTVLKVFKEEKKNLVEHWWFLFLLPVILSVEWLLRKRNGLY